MTETFPRMRHLGICTHPQTPYARRVCRKAAIAAAAQAATVTVITPTYTGGEEIDINGTTIVLIARRRFSRPGIGWSWCTQDRGIFGESTRATAEDAIDHARRVLGAPRCGCGAPATMNASTGKTCINCYDDYAA